jgi:hypothetical protein
MPQVIFLSLFLGLVTGMQTVALQVDAAVKSVRIDLRGREVARLDKAPWSAKVDFGSALTPGELTAIAYDGEGKELARTSQVINLSRPAAEMEIVIRSEGKKPVEAELIGRHRIHKSPESAKLLVDGIAVRLGRGFRARLPDIDPSHPHILSAEMQFEDGEIARRDIVLQTGFSGSLASEVTPLLVTSGSGKQPENLQGCFSAGGVPLNAGSIEKSEALVVLVKDPAMRAQLLPSPDLRLDSDTSERILWPVSRPINAPGEPTAIAFPQYVNHGKLPTVSWLLTQRLSPAPSATEPRQFTDAVAVAAITSLERGRRRAVVLIVSNEPDPSLYSPLVVRRYLEEVGVPLFVWSADGPRLDLAAAWGRIDDISTAAGLQAAVGRLNDMLSRQRIVWVAADPLTALGAEGTERCGLTPVAHHQPLKP